MIWCILPFVQLGGWVRFGLVGRGGSVGLGVVWLLGGGMGHRAVLLFPYCEVLGKGGLLGCGVNPGRL